ncbi:MAG: histidine phosphatase family protein [Sulfuritalea sp.]|nr:histidine phosphatase family protein [Sulfuritalea sp.]
MVKLIPTWLKCIQGEAANPLNSNGRIQAEHAAGQLAGQPVVALFTSPLLRAVETANIVGKSLNLAPQVSPHFNELRMGPWEGLSEQQVESAYPDEFAVWNARPAELALEGRETLEELRARVLAGLVDVRDRHGASPVAIVSHVAVIRVLMLHAHGRPLNDYKKVAVPNATPISLRVKAL